MRVAILSTFDIAGGAAKAAYRLYQGLKTISNSLDTQMFVARKFQDDSSVVQLDVSEQPSLLERGIQDYYIDRNRTPLSNTKFSWTFKGRGESSLDALHDFDLINLHWVEKFFSLGDFEKLVSLGKPIVWTLHDQRPFTGGCHYSMGCVKYRDQCADCPQLRHDPLRLPRTMLNKRLKIFRNTDLSVVSPSEWLAGMARESPLFVDSSVHVVPNGVDTELYKPQDKHQARLRFDIPWESLVINFSAHSLSEIRKGFSFLHDALRLCMDDERFRKLCERQLVTLLCVGTAGAALPDMPFQVKQTGYLMDESDIVAAYNAADIFVLSTLEDNLPCTLMESMACGTAVIAFDVGGVPELVKEGAGRLVPKKRSDLLANEIVALAHDGDTRSELADNARRLIEEQFELGLQTSRYQRVYQDTAAGPCLS